MTLLSALRSTASILRELTVPTVTATVTALCYHGIQVARGITGNDDVQSQTKDTLSAAASTTNVIAMSESALQFISYAITHWQHLTNKQRTAIAVFVLIALPGAGYSLAAFGVEHNTLAAGMSATVAVSSLKLASNLMTHWSDKNKIEGPMVFDDDIPVVDFDESTNDRGCMARCC